jgi:hypothetical protein
VQREDWGKHLSHEEVQALIEVILKPPKWYPLDVTTSEESGIIGYEYTDAEGAPYTRQYSPY